MSKVTLYNDQPIKRSPIHPGEILREEFLPDYALSVRDLAGALGVSRQSIHDLVAERRGISTEMAVRLARLFGNAPEFWLSLQLSYDVYWAEVSLQSELEDIAPLSCA